MMSRINTIHVHFLAGVFGALYDKVRRKERGHL